MHPVQPPQHRHGKEQHVLQVDGEIEENYRGDDRKPNRGLQGLEETPAADLGQECHAEGGQRKDRLDQQGVQDDDPKVAGPAREAPDGLASPRRKQLPQHHRGEDPGEGA